MRRSFFGRLFRPRQGLSQVVGPPLMTGEPMELLSKRRMNGLSAGANTGGVVLVCVIPHRRFAAEFVLLVCVTLPFWCSVNCAARTFFLADQAAASSVACCGSLGVIFDLRV